MMPSLYRLDNNFSSMCNIKKISVVHSGSIFLKDWKTSNKIFTSCSPSGEEKIERLPITKLVSLTSRSIFPAGKYL